MQPIDPTDPTEIVEQPPKRERGGIGILAVFFLVAGVIGSLVFGALSSVAVVLLHTWSVEAEKAEAAAKAESEAAAKATASQQGGFTDPRPASTSARTLKPQKPLPPPPHDLEFVGLPPRMPIDATIQRPTANAELSAAVLERVKKATVLLQVKLPDGSQSQGSGFIGIQQGIVFTNAHVVGMLHPDSPAPARIDAILQSGTKDERSLKALLLAVDRGSDLAVLRLQGEGLPEPLKVCSAGVLRETEQVWIVGFPLGDRLGKEITVSSSSVSSLRREADGSISRIQINGGMHRGNSGGPIVDGNGYVVGVAVSILLNTQINFAVPADLVWAVLQGRLAGLTVEEPYEKDGKVYAHASMRVIDPLERVHKTALEVWQAPPSSVPRSATFKTPARQQKDGPRQRFELAYKRGIASAEIALPPLGTNMAYWVQPSWVNGAGETEWGTGQAYPLAAPLELRPIKIALAPAPFKDELLINTWMMLNLADSQGVRHTRSANKETTLLESVQTVGEANQIRFQFLDFSADLRFDNQPWEQLFIDQIREHVTAVALDARTDRNGEMLDYQLDLTQVPQEARGRYGVMVETVELLHCFAVRLPEKEVMPGESCEFERSIKMNLEDRRASSGTARLTQKYLGLRRSNGKEVAVFVIAGRIQGHDQAALRGIVGGSVVIDVATGVIQSADARIRLNATLSAQFGGSKANGTLIFRCRRQPAAKG